jgi:putative transposase
MKRKASKPRSVEQIIRILRQADSGQTVAEICREHNIAEGTFYRWKKQYGGLEVSEAKRLKGLEKENGELKKMRAEAMLDIRVLKEINSKKWGARRTKNERSSRSLSWIYARRDGRVVWSIWRRRVIIIRPEGPPIGGSAWSSELSRCRKSTHVGAIGLFISCCVAKAGR